MNAPTKVVDESDSALELAMRKTGERARAAALALGRSTAESRTAALQRAARELRAACARITDANRRDMTAAAGSSLSAAMLDRLRLDETRIDAMAAGIETVANLPDPVGRTLAKWCRPNGLEIERVSVPLGVIGIIYESRPNVTADAGALCLRSGNAAILRGGSESLQSSQAIHRALTLYRSPNQFSFEVSRLVRKYVRRKIIVYILRDMIFAQGIE